MPAKGRNGRVICWAFKQNGSFVFYWEFKNKLHYFLFVEYYFKSDLVKGSKTQTVVWWPVDVLLVWSQFFAQNFGNSGENDVVLDKFKVPLHGILLHTIWMQYHTCTRNFSGKLTIYPGKLIGYSCPAFPLASNLSSIVSVHVSNYIISKGSCFK